MPTGMVATTVFVAVLMTETVLLPPWFVPTTTDSPPRTAAATGDRPTGMAVGATVLVGVPMTETLPGTSPLLGTYTNGPCCAGAASGASRASAPSQAPPSSAARVAVGRVVAATRIDPPDTNASGAARCRSATRRAAARVRRVRMTFNPRPRPPGSPVPCPPSPSCRRLSEHDARGAVVPDQFRAVGCDGDCRNVCLSRHAGHNAEPRAGRFGSFATGSGRRKPSHVRYAAESLPDRKGHGQTFRRSEIAKTRSASPVSISCAQPRRTVLQQIKQCRPVVTRYDKLAANYLAFVKLASIRIWLRANESTPWLRSTRRMQLATSGRENGTHV